MRVNCVLFNRRRNDEGNYSNLSPTSKSVLILRRVDPLVDCYVFDLALISARLYQCFIYLLKHSMLSTYLDSSFCSTAFSAAPIIYGAFRCLTICGMDENGKSLESFHESHYASKSWIGLDLGLDLGLITLSSFSFTVRRLANLHRYTVQCVLMINMFNEKIYLFIWFWFLFVAISTVINFIYCLVTMVPASAREHRAAQLLRASKFDDLADSADDRRVIRRFVHNGLRPDGLLLLRFVDGHAGAIVARDLSAQLFADFAERALIAPNMIRRGDDMGGGGGSHSTKSTSPGGGGGGGGMDDGFSEQLYDPTASANGKLMMPINSSAMSTLLAPDGGGYPGPPITKPKPKLG